MVYDDLVRQGKLRYVALSNHPAWQVTQALWIADDRHPAAAPVCGQVKYNLIDRAAEDELAPASQQFGVSIVPFGPLHGGLLAGMQVEEREFYLARQQEPPLRFAAGADAVAAFERRANNLLAQANAYRDLSSSLALDSD